jgi:hypothetical protein
MEIEMNNKFENMPEPTRNYLEAKYEEEGLKIPFATEIELTDWAVENGIKHKNPNRKYIKLSNDRTKGYISVLGEGQRQPTHYWAGFWKAKHKNENT